ncbi:MAG: 3-dehydroquinate synthase [Chlamydiota bacterium]
MLTISCFNSYEISIGYNLLKDATSFADTLKSMHKKIVIISDEQTAVLYSNTLQKSLLSHGLTVFLFSFPNGEIYKTRATKERLENQMLEANLARDTCLIALGGGITTDLGGFLAATYCRGLPLIMIPTSLLAMVDASLGGKNGVNTPYGKNMIGCIYQPTKVLIDLSTLQTLPKKELSNGFVEMIKHGVIASKCYFEYLENHVDQLLSLEPTLLEKAVFESCLIKKNIIEADEKDSGKRNLLNFGHTIGHGLEHLSNYAISHGEAVAIGIVVESYLSMQLGFLDERSFQRIWRILLNYKLNLKLPFTVCYDTLFNALSLDKKSLQGKPRFIIVNTIGSTVLFNAIHCVDIKEDLLKQAINWMNDALCCN